MQQTTNIHKEVNILPVDYHPRVEEVEEKMLFPTQEKWGMQGMEGEEKGKLMWMFVMPIYNPFTP